MRGRRQLARPADPNLALATGGTPLMLASRNGDSAAVKSSLMHGARVNTPEEANGQTALMWAVAQRHSEVVGLLLAAGADIRARSTSVRRVVLLCCPTWPGDLKEPSKSIKADCIR